MAISQRHITPGPTFDVPVFNRVQAARQILCRFVHGSILSVYVMDSLAKRDDRRQGVRIHPKKMTRIQIFAWGAAFQLPVPISNAARPRSADTFAASGNERCPKLSET